MLVEIPLRSAKINGDAQTIALPVEDVVAALIKAAKPMSGEELEVLAVRCVKEILYAKETDRA